METFLFNIANGVLEKLASSVFQEIRLARGVGSDLEKLRVTISTIKAVLLDAEEKQAKDHQLTAWLGNIKDALYDADDVLDEFQCEALRRQVVNSGGKRKKVRYFLSWHSNPPAFRIEMGRKIKEIREKLDGIAAERDKFHLRRQQSVDIERIVHGEREISHSFVPLVRDSDVIGRRSHKENIVRLLMHPSGDVSIVPIVGIGGIGKTTLAKLVYNDERISRHFDLKWWVCVFQQFDLRKLIKEILKSAMSENCEDLTMDRLQTLRSTLDNKKFLLVLDDVWNTDDPGKLIELRNLLLGSAKGSRIVLTTRDQSVASIMGTIDAYNLKGLSDEDCLSLFVKWAFRKGEEKQYPNLIKIADKIVKKCGGVPLAVRTLGSLHFSNTWLFVKDNEIWQLVKNETGILPVLRLSYDQMPSYLKQCFVYCSIFPKDHEFDNVELVQLWMAQGLLQSSDGNQELEDIGQQYLKELWSRSFFQYIHEQGTLLMFKMPDLIHDLALSMAQTEGFNISKRAQTECSNENFQIPNIPRARHVSFLGKVHIGKKFQTFYSN